MAFTLLALANGHSSLEFDPEDIDAVGAIIREQFGKPDIVRYTFSAEYRFGGCSFAFQNEWGDPCLISGLAEGDDILRSIYEILVSQSLSPRA